MRLLLVSHCFPPDNRAGVELYTANVAARLAAAGHEVDVLTRRLAPGVRCASVEVERLADGVRVHRIVREPTHRARRADAAERDVRRAAVRVLREARPEVVHATHLMHHAPRLLDDARRAGAGVVLSLLDFFVVCPRAHLVRADGGPCDGPGCGEGCAAACLAGAPGAERRARRRRAGRLSRALAVADRVLCPSRFVHDYFLPRVPDPRRLVTLPLGILEAPAPGAAPPLPRAEPPLPAAPPLPADPAAALELAFVGALVAHKGADVLVEALARARLQRVRLRLIGQAPDAAYLAALEARAAAVPGLTLVRHPPFEPGELPRLLAGADAVVVPSRVAETYSFVAREALACGLPVLASRLGALPEVVRDGDNGALFDPARPEELADALTRLARDPAHRRRLAAGAAATTIPRLDAHVEALVTLYRDLAGVRRPATFAARVRALLRPRRAAPPGARHA